MSLHRYFVPPPLALAVHPAPPPKPKPTEKEKEKAAEKEAKDKKDNQQDKDKDNKKADRAEDKKDEKEKEKEEEPATPATPGSMVPEPPTPVPDADDKPETPKVAKADDDHKRSAEENKPTEKPAEAKEDKTKPRSTGENITDLAPEPEPEEEKEKPLEPIRLLPPAPFRPIRTKLDLNPLKPYPPVPTDPRGAYHAYAKAVGNEVIYVDVTKDGWLTEQWKERSEREALKRLTGEWERELQRELEKQRENEKVREVPRTAQGILLELWNVLVEADNHEIAVDEFWAKFDWTKESAKVHLSNIRRELKDDEKKGEPDDKKDEGPTKKSDAGAKGGGEAEPATGNNEKKEDLPNGDTTSTAEAKKDEKEAEIEWTKEGLEEILSTVGVQCVYNVEKPSRHWAHPAGGYLLLSHNYFLLRTDMHINFKPEEKAGQFEVLVTSGHDRVFGEMVKAQREKEYRERKEREKKERLAKEKADDKDKDKGKKDDKDQGQDEKKKDETPSPGTPTSNLKLIDGEAIVPAAGDAVALLDKKDDKVIIAVPVDAKDQANGEDKDKDKDKKHEQEPAIVPGPKPAAPAPREKEGKAEKPMNMDDIAKAFKALESSVSKAVDLKDKEKEKEKVKLVWTWSERCEMWRWKNFEMGLHNVGPGGWEERDWKVFADGREVWDFDDDEKVVEVEEEDIHDWSL